MKPALLLLPNLLGNHRFHEPFLPSSVDKAVSSIDGLIAESETGGRRFLSRFSHKISRQVRQDVAPDSFTMTREHCTCNKASVIEDKDGVTDCLNCQIGCEKCGVSRFHTKRPFREIPIAILNKKTDDFDFLLEPIHKGERWGLVSDCGLPCIADPGAKLVARARSTGILVQAFIGPSAVTYSLMLSGIYSQRFFFHGYLKKENRKKLILKLERERGITHIFIETPYRNQALLEELVDTLNDQTLLCVAWELTMPDQGVLSQPISLWKKSPLPNLNKKNAIFHINSDATVS